MKLRIAIVDDERPSRGELRHKILELEPDSEIFEADCGASALKLFQSEDLDLVFLDINLNDIPGTTLASVLKQILPDVSIIFATAYSEYALQAFEIGVDNYLLKPIDTKRLSEVLKACHDKIKKPATAIKSDKIAISNGRKLSLINVEDIVYVETSGRGCKLNLKGEQLIDNHLIGEYEDRLPKELFMRVHKSFLINLREIAELSIWESNSYVLRMNGYNELLPVSRKKVRELKELLSF